MLKFHPEIIENILRKRFYSLKTSKENTKNFQHTIFLPKTDFLSYLKPEQVIERDQKIKKEAGFLEYYAWQRENLRGKEFVFHDGPPYANGKPHIGHAINKILKDIILRSQLVQGNRVHYVPGWDCHGLPIEMIALKDIKHSLTTKELRQKAREVAHSMSQIQMEAFKHWGVIGDWNNNCYYTYNTKYIVNQLQIFWKLFEKGLIYYDLKPVFWSPSSRTALAEAELLYKAHESNAVTVSFEIVQESVSEPLYLLVWTTTPWTLPLNKAVYCSTALKYSIVKIASFPGLYIIATDLIEAVQKKLQKEIIEHSLISNEELKKLKYKHPWNKNDIMNVFDSSSVKLSGTGLLHSVPGHGHEDFLLALENNMEVKCFVDEKGCYTKEVGPDLAGLDVLGKGSKYVLEKLSSNIILEEKYTHSYPYDWRTNQPVIIRASKQWFIDCDQLKERALESLKKVEVPLKLFESKLKSRPYWCLSRQRKWGVPIPVFYHKISGRPLISRDLIHYLCQLFESNGPDIWWTEKLEILFPAKVCTELFVEIENVVKGEDIMDIWFDSGVSWYCVLDGKKSELYLEGVDQYGGWFQSSFLTSVAVQNDAPFKKLMTHGFAVDQDGRKMSKSLGNVLDPEAVVLGKGALGVDTLRWWVACHSSQDLVPASKEILKSSFDTLQKIRLTFRFLLGALNDVSQFDIENDSHLGSLDRFLLNSCYKYYHSILKSYNSYNIQKVTSEILFFVVNEISSRYITAIKDRLYCDQLNTIRRKACQYTANGILQTLCHTVAPILPHLAEEVYLHHPVYKTQKKLFYNNKMWMPPNSWKNDSLDSVMKLIDGIKEELFTQKNLPKFSCLIEIDKENFELLKKMQNGKEESIDSELTEILQVAKVQLKIGSRKISLSPIESSFCLRCRRYTVNESEDLCKRCENVISVLVSYLF